MCHLTVICFVYVLAAVSSVSVNVPNATCSSSYAQFECRSGGCVDVSSVCDGVSDCKDDSDEEDCDTGLVSYDHVTEHPLGRWKRQAYCNKNQWQCKDGTCISFDGKCDGVKDCPDESDETFPLCRKNECLPHWFRCTYGACVDGTAPCNHIQDCADNSDELLPRCRNENPIANGRFKCDDGSTIPAYEYCDGERNCHDGSDETIRACAGMKCAKYVFQCAYGACVDANANCNGKVECADGSDESDELCNRSGTSVVPVAPVVVGHGNCILPAFPQNGSYVVIGKPEARPGHRFPTVAINLTCHQGFGVVGSKERVCFGGVWNDDNFRCARFCRLHKDPSIKYKCVLDKSAGSGDRPCGEYEPDGTQVVPECSKDYYYTGSLGYMHCTEGSWNYWPQCTLECGLGTPYGGGLIAGPEGRPAQRGELPWHTGIYRKTASPYEQVCGGSLVRARVVISAGHCFWNQGRALPPNLYEVALGKIHRVWNDERDNETDVQRSQVLAIHLPELFLGPANNFQEDIAVLQLKETIVFYPHVRPVCTSFDVLFERTQLVETAKGRVAGWGLTGANEPSSDILKTIEMPFISIRKCLADSPPDFRVYISRDKLCAGYRNGSAVCHGDSGGGLAFPATDERGLTRYYLRGLVSTAPADGNDCNVNWLTTFTQISSHEHFLRPFL